MALQIAPLGHLDYLYDPSSSEKEAKYADFLRFAKCIIDEQANVESLTEGDYRDQLSGYIKQMEFLTSSLKGLKEAFPNKIDELEGALNQAQKVVRLLNKKCTISPIRSVPPIRNFYVSPSKNVYESSEGKAYVMPQYDQLLPFAREMFKDFGEKSIGLIRGQNLRALLLTFCT